MMTAPPPWSAPGASRDIRTVIASPVAGRLVLLGLPGLVIDYRGQAALDPAELALTAAALAAIETAALIVLIEGREAPAGWRGLLRDGLGHHGIRLLALPIRDFQPPGATWLRAWARLESWVLASLGAGQALALSCSYGAGRSGMIAAHILRRQGMAGAAALALVRAGFAEAVESPEQEAWVCGPVTSFAGASPT